MYLLTGVVAVAPTWGGLESVGEGSFLEHDSAIKILLRIIALQFVLLLVELIRKVVLCFSPRLAGALLRVIQ